MDTQEATSHDKPTLTTLPITIQTLILTFVAASPFHNSKYCLSIIPPPSTFSASNKLYIAPSTLRKFNLVSRHFQAEYPISQLYTSYIFSFRGGLIRLRRFSQDFPHIARKIEKIAVNQVNDIILPFERKEGNLIPRVNFLLSNFFNGYGNLKELEIKYISLQEHAEKVKEGIKGLVWTGELSNLTSPAPPSPPKSPIKIRVLDFARGIWNKKRVDALNATLKFRLARQRFELDDPNYSNEEAEYTERLLDKYSADGIDPFYIAE